MASKKQNDGKSAKPVGFKAGGVTSMAMKKFGRNVARAKNQRGK